MFVVLVLDLLWVAAVVCGLLCFVVFLFLMCFCCSVVLLFVGLGLFVVCVFVLCSFCVCGVVVRVLFCYLSVSGVVFGLCCFMLGLCCYGAVDCVVLLLLLCVACA